MASNPDAGTLTLAATALELCIDFRSLEAWSQWQQVNGDYYNEWRNRIIESIRISGLEEPFSGVKHDPATIKIDTGNLRESLSVNEMNSRKRAVLYVLSGMVRLPSYGLQRRIKILGAEALTRAAAILRQYFPYYLGCEYLPTAEERNRFFPIPHLDLNKIEFPNESFDIFYSSDVFEHLPDLHHSLIEVYNSLKPGGLLVSGFPFLSERQTSIVRARLTESGTIEHIESPEYHGNPVRPNEGALVFSVPGWDIIKECESAGFKDAKMTFVMSSRFGITSSGAPGVFVLSALKDGADPARARIFATPSTPDYSGPALDRVIGIAALQRSGTTVLSAVLGAHSRIHSVYEPWNANKTKLDLNKPISLQEFLERFSIQVRDKDILLVKETSTDLRYLDRLSDLLTSVPYPITRDLVVILRNPFHTFQSEVQARKEWWGEGALEISCALFDKWAERSLVNMRRLLLMARRYDALVVSYERLVRKKTAIEELMNALDITMEHAQLEYEKHVNTRDVRGDVGLASQPRPLQADSIERRNLEQQSTLSLIHASSHFEKIKAMENTLFSLEQHPFSRANQSPPLTALLSQLDIVLSNAEQGNP